MKRFLVCLFAVSIILSGFTLTASARGHHGYKLKTTATTSNQPARCNTTDCNYVGSHYHDDVLYSGHHYNDGHSHNNLSYDYSCGVEGNHNHGQAACYYNNYTTSNNAGYTGGCCRR